MIDVGSICVFGHSIVWGAWDLDKGGWVNRLRLWFDDFDDTDEGYHAVYNLGIPGDNSLGVLSRIKSECSSRNPNIIIIGIGANDAANENHEVAVPIDDFEDNISEIISLSKSIAEKVVFLNIQSVDESRTCPVEWDNTLFYSNKRISEYNDVLAKICKKEGISIIEINNLNKNDLYDGIHLTSAGHEKIFVKVRDFLVNNEWI